MSNVLSRIYYDARNPASYSTATKLFKEARLAAPTLTLKQVKDWLQGEFTYTLHKPVRHNYPRNKILVSTINEQWQADLVDMQEFSSSNNGYKYILTVIDLFSKFAYALPLKNKKADTVVNAFNRIFKERLPAKLQTDQGKEFVNSKFQQLLRKLNIKFFTSHNDKIKCAVVERFNRTLKSKMFKYFTAKGTRRYIDVLSDLVSAYNNTYHRTIKTKPVNVTHSNEKEIFFNIYGKSNLRKLFNVQRNRETLQKHDPVRWKYKHNPFDKGYYPNWSDKVYTVNNVTNTGNHTMFTIMDENKNLVRGRQYKHDIQPIKQSNIFRIEKILNRRIRNGKVEYLVKWLNHSSEHNSWIPKTNVKNL